MRKLALVFALLAAPPPALAQADKVVTGTFATTGTSMSITLEGSQGVSVMADGTCTGLSFAPQVSTNGTIWANTRMYDVANGTVVASGGEGTFIIMGVGGMYQARLNITVLTATCDFTMRATVASGLPASVASAGVAVTSFPDNEPINVAQINGVTPLMGNGASGTGAQRVTLASDSTGVIADITNPINAIVDSGTLTAVTSITNPVTAESTDSTEQGHPRVPAADGTAIQLSCTTSTSTAAVFDGVTYRMGITGASAMVIWGGTAALTTGFSMPEGMAEYQRAEGTAVACITAAGTGTLTLTPATFDD